ncbi:MAG: helix-turn-helix domain-containing protein [Bacteroidaceae bacterium]|nr:helix-turn-helix domain-containing protein [Bacteroidaceae bacterium]
MQKYCSEECAEQAKETKKKRQRDFLRAVEPVMELQQHEYLTFSKAAILLGCTRQYVYKLVEQGKLPASRLSSRMALVRRSDIEKMFAANPYKRVLPCSKPKKAVPKKQRTASRKNTKIVQSTKEVLEYYSGEEVMQTYKVKQSWLYASAKRHQIPMCRIAGRNYYSKKHIDAVFGTQEKQMLADHIIQQESLWHKQSHRLTDIVRNNEGVWLSQHLFYIVGSLSLLSIITIVLEIAFYVYFNWIT